MSPLTRTMTMLALAAGTSGCLGGLLGGGKPPPTLGTLSSEAPDPGAVARSAAAGQAVTIAVPVIPKELRTTRVPVQVAPTAVQYVTKFEWADTPDRLFQQLLAETVRRMTRRVVLDPKQSALDPGLLVTGQLHQFGYDSATGQAVVEYDAALSTAGGTHVQNRRFRATAPADGSAATIGPALNRAANQVAMEVAGWIGG